MDSSNLYYDTVLLGKPKGIGIENCKSSSRDVMLTSLKRTPYGKAKAQSQFAD
jgi:hypothetical protein